MPSGSKSRLSKSILDMKFMKRTKEKVQKEDDAAEGRAMYSSEITSAMEHGNNFVIDTSFVNCADLIVGRFSCGGMNPELERILEREEQADVLAKADETRAKKAEMIKDVSDESMVKHYSSLVKTLGKKFDKFKKRKHAGDKDEATGPRENAKQMKLDE